MPVFAEMGIHLIYSQSSAPEQQKKRLTLSFSVSHNYL